ncbi:Zinc finger CCCH domain-containing protein 1 [Balamuthia mandrillaris]
MEPKDAAEVASLFAKRKKRSRAHARKKGKEEDVGEAATSTVKESSLKKKRMAGGLEQKVVKEKLEDPLEEYDSSKTAMPLGSTDQLATATLETETPVDRDARAIQERAKQLNQDPDNRQPEDLKTYKGLSNYTQYIQARPVPKAARAGPVRTSLHIRVSNRFDYQPDICKDWKETGYCGYGDSCKFMHDRGDYKSGWQLEKEWEELMANSAQRRAELEVSSSDSDDDLPFACFICRKPFTDPVVTRCGHYFCERCALKHHRKDTKCYVCKEQTNGIFNQAKDLRRKLELKKRKLEEKEAKRQQAGGEADEQEEDN